MRANEFINEGWYDDAKARVKSATAAVSAPIKAASRNAQAATLKTARKINPTLKTAVNVGSNALGKAAGGIDKAMSYVPNMTMPDTTKQGRTDRLAAKKYIEGFKKEMEFNIQSAAKQGVKFNLGGFINGYLTKYHWKPGALKPQLDKAIASNDRYNIPAIMAQIGKLNTGPQGGQEIQGSFGTDAEQATAAATAQPAAPAQKQQVSKAAKQINNTIPRLNKIDVASVKQTADATYARKAASTMPQTGTVH